MLRDLTIILTWFVGIFLHNNSEETQQNQLSNKNFTFLTVRFYISLIKKNSHL